MILRRGLECLKELQRMPQNSNVLPFPETANKQLLGILEEFENGNGSIALQRCLSLVDQGDSDANLIAGYIYEQGSDDVPFNYEYAKFYYESCINQSGTVAAYLGMARIYLYGLGVEQDYRKAWSIYEEIVEKSGNVKAYLMLGQMAQYGLGHSQDLSLAREYYSLAWKGGYIFGLTFLGLLEQASGNLIKGWCVRLKAGWHTLKVVWREPDDPSISYPSIVPKK
ncbi:MAG: hypothetical protein DRQ54_10725 [Gammaproteobacteria bacterium]|nr:MAG: hypothetical protein DRQ54_10725 [Gammaproteobacteria bacterium]